MAPWNRRPQVATIGLSEQEAIARGEAYEARTLPMGAVPRALANFDERGMVKLIAAKGSRRLLGAHIVAENAGDMIQTVAMAMKGNLTVQDLSATLFPYLTGVEGIRLCAQIFSTDVAKLSCCADGDVEEESPSAGRDAPCGVAHACCSKGGH